MRKELLVMTNLGWGRHLHMYVTHMSSGKGKGIPRNSSFLVNHFMFPRKETHRISRGNARTMQWLHPWESLLMRQAWPQMSLSDFFHLDKKWVDPMLMDSFLSPHLITCPGFASPKQRNHKNRWIWRTKTLFPYSLEQNWPKSFIHMPFQRARQEAVNALRVHWLQIRHKRKATQKNRATISAQKEIIWENYSASLCLAA